MHRNAFFTRDQWREAPRFEATFGLAGSTRTARGALIQRLAQEGFDHWLPAHVEARGTLVEFPQHSTGQIHIHPANRPDDHKLIG